MAKISIVVPAYEAERFLGLTLDGVRAQSLTDWELVVVDDGSSDGTAAVAARFAAADRRIRLVVQANSGVASARNRGLEETDPHSAYVIFLDHDDVWEPDALATLAGAMERDPEAVAAYGLARFIDAAGRLQAPGDLEAWGRQRRGLTLERSIDWPRQEPTTFAVLVLRNCITTPGQVLIRRQALAASGPFDPATAPADDWDLWLRLSCQGHLAFVDHVVIGWRQHDRNASRQMRRMHRAASDTVGKLTGSPHLTDEQRRLLQLAGRWTRWESSRSRLNWAKGSLAQGKLLTAANQLRHAAADRIMFHRTKV